MISKVIYLIITHLKKFERNNSPFSEGLSDKNGVMCLIDPQSHSYVVETCLTDADKVRFIHRSEEDSEKRPYWDGGPKKIALFMAHHLKDCENNPICRSLRLLTVEFEDELDLDKVEKAKSPKKKNPKSPLKKCARKSFFIESAAVNLDDIIHID